MAALFFSLSYLPGQVLNGIDNLVLSSFKPLEGLRVGLITNHSGRDKNGESTIDLLHASNKLKLVKLFSPEHGIRGTADGKVGDSIAMVEQFITEDITLSDLKEIERYADKLFAAVGIDVEFTKHFHDRANDPRNDKPITTAELLGIFKRTYKKYGKRIRKLNPGAQGVIKDMRADINMPFVINIDKNGMLDLVAKTVMRKKNFKTSNMELPI